MIVANLTASYRYPSITKSFVLFSTDLVDIYSLDFWLFFSRNSNSICVLLMKNCIATVIMHQKNYFVYFL